MRVLREFIRGVLQEAAISPESAYSSGKALFVLEDSEGILKFDMVVLADIKAIEDLLEEFNLEDVKSQLDFEEQDIDAGQTMHYAASKLIDAMIEVGPSKDRGQAYDAWTVHTSAATKGYGPMMYDVAMSLVAPNPLMSDRHSVSQKARSVWNKYYSERPDVEKLPLDDVDDPKTPTPVDDGEVFKSPSSKALNYAYTAGKTANPAVKKLFRRGDMMLKLHPGLEDLLVYGASKFFGIKYFE